MVVGVKIKNKKLKVFVFLVVFLVGFGIIELVIFGVNLCFGKLFIMGLIVGVVGGWLVLILKLVGIGFGIIIILGILFYLNG